MRLSVIGRALAGAALVGGVATTLSPARAGPQSGDDALIREVITVYFRGHETGRGDVMRPAFLPTARIEGLRRGELVSWTVDEYVANFRGQPAADEGTRRRVIDVVDVNGTAAMARATLVHGATTFTDYFILLKVDGHWRIASKVYHAKR